MHIVLPDGVFDSDEASGGHASRRGGNEELA